MIPACTPTRQSYNVGMDSAMVTTKQILERTGIQTGRTLTRWYQRGLIPPPEIRISPTGNGKSAYWPDWVVHRCDRIRRLIKSGRSLDEIGEMLVSIDSEARHPNRKYIMKEVYASLEYERASEDFVA